MESNDNKNVKNILLNSSRNLTLSTMVSRILGFFREVLMAGVIGAGVNMSAWVLAITLPNLFRRILGEGALGTALVPMIVHAMNDEGEERARERFSTVFIWLTFLLAAITVLIALPALFLADSLPAGHWRLAAKLTPVVMPYCIFICCVGVLTSYANSLREYFLPSLTAILQNIILIGGLFLIFKGAVSRGTDELFLMGASVLLSGLLELLLMFRIIQRKNMMVKISAKIFRDTETIRSLFFLALPGIIGASALQLSLIADRLIAGWIGAYAPSALYYSERLVYLPIGVFAFAFQTVSLSEMSRAAAKEDYRDMVGMMMFSLRNLLFVTVPIAVFMFLFSEDMIRLFYMRGKFDAAALRETLLAMQFYVCGIPFFAASKVLVTGFTARKDMKTPLFITLITVSANILLNLALMIPLKQGGIALATVLTALLSNLLMLGILRKKFGSGIFEFRETGLMLAKLCLVTLPAGTGAYFAGQYIYPGNAFLNLLAGFLVFALLFIPAGLLCRLTELNAFLRRFLKIKV